MRSTSEAPRPPYSLGQETPAQPPSYTFFCQALRNCKSSLEACGCRWRNCKASDGTLAASQERNCWRNPSLSGVKQKSIILPLLLTTGYLPTVFSSTIRLTSGGLLSLGSLS